MTTSKVFKIYLISSQVSKKDTSNLLANLHIPICQS
uniref:Uncharacterized protein n=1 Tax=Arundo donax TaxID=35708 RepID=A0A0A9GVW0_ARUDO